MTYAAIVDKDSDYKEFAFPQILLWVAVQLIWSVVMILWHGALPERTSIFSMLRHITMYLVLQYKLLLIW